MVTKQQRVVTFLAEANPVPELDAIDVALGGNQYLATLNQRSSDVTQTVTRPEHETTAPRRRLVLALGLVAATILIAVVAILSQQNRAPEPAAPNPYGLIDFSTDLSLVGVALTEAQATYDPEVFLSLFAEDARLITAVDTYSPESLRTAGLLDDQGPLIQYDRGWARTMNEQNVYSSCVVNGDRVTCDVTTTSDYLAPILRPTEYQVGMQIADGKIVLFAVSGGFPDKETLDAFQAWTYQNYPAEAALMWRYSWDSHEVVTEESARMHLQLGAEYVQQLGE